MKRTIALAIATGLGAGYFPIAPGTAGSIFPGLALAWALAAVAPWAGLAAAGPLFLAGWWAAGRSEAIFGGKDPGRVVIDEVVGMLIATALAAPRPEALLGGLVLFRIFDIWKPWPVRLADRRIPGGLGIMVDDVLAGIYARAALEVFLRAI